MEKTIRLSLCQMKVTDDKKSNLRKAVGMIEKSALNNSRIVMLPEMFNCPYDNSKFREYAEEGEAGPTVTTISRAAKDFDVHVVAGSIPELDSGKIYNTCYIFDNRGEIIGKHRKMHLFDINVPGSIVFRESDTLTAGDSLTVVDTGFCKLGAAICYDVRFPEIFRLMVSKGAQIIAIPAAFNMTTGPLHWELLMRARAVDYQVFVAAISPARDENASYVAYGNSIVVGPWADIAARAGHEECILYADIDLGDIEKAGRKLPVLAHKRDDVYEVLYKKDGKKPK